MVGTPDHPLDPRQVWVWTVGWGLAGLGLAAVVLVGDLALSAAGSDVRGPTGLTAAAVAVMTIAAAAVLPRIAHRRWRYRLGPTELELRRGIVVRTETSIPYRRVQHIDITRSPVERSLGLSELVVRTAAATTDATLPGVAVAEAEALRDVILARARAQEP